jgi:hypothetical protein
VTTVVLLECVNREASDAATWRIVLEMSARNACDDVGSDKSKHRTDAQLGRLRLGCRSRSSQRRKSGNGSVDQLQDSSGERIDGFAQPKNKLRLEKLRGKGSDLVAERLGGRNDRFAVGVQEDTH